VSGYSSASAQPANLEQILARRINHSQWGKKILKYFNI